MQLKSTSLAVRLAYLGSKKVPKVTNLCPLFWRIMLNCLMIVVGVAFLGLMVFGLIASIVAIVTLLGHMLILAPLEVGMVVFSGTMAALAFRKFGERFTRMVEVVEPSAARVEKGIRLVGKVVGGSLATIFFLLVLVSYSIGLISPIWRLVSGGGFSLDYGESFCWITVGFGLVAIVILKVGNSSLWKVFVGYAAAKKDRVCPRVVIVP